MSAPFTPIPTLQTHPLFHHLAAKYIWWQTPEEALRRPERVVAQVMELGEFRDVEALAALVGDDMLRQVLQTAEAGWFGPRSWHYWHYRLRLCRAGGVPPLPQRIIPPSP